MQFPLLCPPAKLYFIISTFAVIIMLFQNMGTPYSKYCLGYYSCDMTNKSVIFLLKMVYIIFWTIVLNMFCDNGFTILSWFFVLIPLLLFFLIILLTMTFGTNNYLNEYLF
jgi:hypothetical protein